MVDIDYIYDLLDWNNDKNTQEKGLELARKVKNIDVFLQPDSIDKGYGMNIWDNCAIILAEKTDEELMPYLSGVFEWLQDLTWPGAWCILECLNQFEKNDMYYRYFEDCVKHAKVLNDDNWLRNLYKIERYEGENQRIAEIIEMLDISKPFDVQEKGLKLAKEIDKIGVFLQPFSQTYGENVWHNCAKVLVSRTDEELELYLWELLEWLENLETPGALLIVERLKRFSGKRLVNTYKDAVAYALEYSKTWSINLSLLYENEELALNLEDCLRNAIRDIYDMYWNRR